MLHPEERLGAEACRTRIEMQAAQTAGPNQTSQTRDAFKALHGAQKSWIDW
jgi:hypothetical protein